MEEYIIRTATHIEWQKWLNQWKHKYSIKLLKIVDKGDQCTIYLIRSNKED